VIAAEYGGSSGEADTGRWGADNVDRAGDGGGFDDKRAVASARTYTHTATGVCTKWRCVYVSQRTRHAGLVHIHTDASHEAFHTRQMPRVRH